MPEYGFKCETCVEDSGLPVQQDVFLQTSKNYSEAIFPNCPKCSVRMVRTYQEGGRIAFRSKGVFPMYVEDMETESVGDTGPVYVADYQDYKRKLKERNLVEKAPSKGTSHFLGNRWL